MAQRAKKTCNMCGKIFIKKEMLLKDGAAMYMPCAVDMIGNAAKKAHERITKVEEFIDSVATKMQRQDMKDPYQSNIL